MGGFGSGSWDRWQKKRTVEDSLAVTMQGFRRRIQPGAAGTVTWTWADGGKSSVGWFVTFGEWPSITLHYRWRESEDVMIPIWLETTPTQFGGERWWFLCPLIVKGVECNRRVGKLYLPRGAKYFGCRTCYGLTYRSCQEAHQEERLFAGIERMERWVNARISRKR